MYILIGSNVWNNNSGINYEAGVSQLVPDANCMCEVLDTSDMSIDQLDRIMLEAINKAYKTKHKAAKSIKIQGVNFSADGKVSGIFTANNFNYISGSDFVFQYIQETNRGSFCTFRIYRRDGIEPFVGTTPHVTGNWDWDFELGRESADRFEIIPYIRDKRHGKIELSSVIFYKGSKATTFIKEFDRMELSGY